MKKETYEAWFFDLGGTLLAIAEDEIARDRAGRVQALPGVVDRLKAMRSDLIFVVSNQAGVAEGSLGADEADNFVHQLNALTGGAIRDWRFCTHPKTAGCRCRKPKPGLLLDLARVHDVELAKSVMIGDGENDKFCAEAAGIGQFVRAHEFFNWQGTASSE